MYYNKTNTMNKKSKLRQIFFCIAAIFSLWGFACNKPYLPWNSGTRWQTASNGQASVERSREEPQIPLEDFCKDNRSTVEAYRRFLDPNYDWGISSDAEERRREYTKRFVEQYDERCN